MNGLLAILSLLSEGATDEATARSLNISCRTVERRLGNLATMLGATSRFQLGCLCSHYGLVSITAPEPPVQLPKPPYPAVGRWPLSNRHAP
ncbi:helix-turn-helix transcriptional regulator [Micromonospora sp. NBC_00898]|uniref:helix-turn-helix domain-containing protein n=1 Tax=Micromonospora sp. NBC_00898 TaxID=2975981 RepID=UPI00387017BB